MARDFFLVVVGLLIAASAQAQPVPGGDTRRAELLPAIRGATNCISREVLKDSGAAEAVQAGRIDPLLPGPIKRCDAAMHFMIAEHDRIYGPATGQEFFQGPYLSDLPRAVTARVKQELQRQASAQTPPPVARSEAKPRTPDEPRNPPAQPSRPWQETVAAEHASRKNRLQELTQKRLRASPEFYEALISKAELPEGFGVDVPVLRVVFPQRVFFDTDKDAIRTDAQQVIEVVADALKAERSTAAVFIAGHTDARGSDEYNFNLSVRRAESVARALERKGIPNVSYWRVGFGKAVPLVANTSEEGMARNRRVEFLFARQEEALRIWSTERQGSVICSESPESTRGECQKAIAKTTTVEAAPVGPAASEKQNIPITVVRREPVMLERIERRPIDLRDPPIEVGRPQR
jgi:outer membrane protein OmpA-like peptidoglycan-associated protein